jgi:hypothetical protein
MLPIDAIHLFRVAAVGLYGPTPATRPDGQQSALSPSAEAGCDEGRWDAESLQHTFLFCHLLPLPLFIPSALRSPQLPAAPAAPRFAFFLSPLCFFNSSRLFACLLSILNSRLVSLLCLDCFSRFCIPQNSYQQWRRLPLHLHPQRRRQQRLSLPLVRVSRRVAC